MKKSGAWIPSDETMARELKQLGRGIEAYRAAKSKAEAAGEPFHQPVPPQLNGETVHVILDKLDDIAARMGHSVGNMLDDEKETWKQFHSALVVEGFSSVVLQQHEVCLIHPDIVSTNSDIRMFYVLTYAKYRYNNSKNTHQASQDNFIAPLIQPAK